MVVNVLEFKSLREEGSTDHKCCTITSTHFFALNNVRLETKSQKHSQHTSLIQILLGFAFTAASEQTSGSLCGGAQPLPRSQRAFIGALKAVIVRPAAGARGARTHRNCSRCRCEKAPSGTAVKAAFTIVLFTQTTTSPSMGSMIWWCDG